MKTKFVTLCVALVLSTSLSAVSLNAQLVKPVKPFLIQGKLPHYVSMLKNKFDDKEFALSDKQKEKLSVVKKNTIMQVKALKKKINKLESYIVKASFDGIKPENLKDDMDKLASFRAQASMVHLECIYQTRAILTKEQIKILK